MYICCDDSKEFGWKIDDFVDFNDEVINCRWVDVDEVVNCRWVEVDKKVHEVDNRNELNEYADDK
jgi:hypothetical protein